MTGLDAVLARMKRLHPLLIDLSLGRIERLLVKLGSPHLSLPPVVHVAGTNGKGSVTAMLRAIAEAAGLRAHVYTSPHLVRFNERIVLAGPAGTPSAPIPEHRLVDLLERVERVNDGDDITFFEITTAAALLAFAETPADIVLLEVGLGGRLDSTNVVRTPRLTIITPVAMDHADKLGDTIAKIAAEKAGIMKPGVTCVVARQDDEAAPVIENHARRTRARLVTWGQDYEAFEQRGRLVFQEAERLIDLPLPALIGSHQIGNAGVAVAAALELADLGIDDRAIEEGLRRVEWPARMQRLNAGPLAAMLRPGSELWLDGGHNPSGAAAIADTLAALEERAPKPLVLIMGLMGQKDARGVLAHFRGLARSIVTVPIPGAHERPFTPEALAALAREMGFETSVAPDVATALRDVEAASDEAKRIMICGSLYLAGHVLAFQDGVTVQSN
jgi:dihydrofolate synthase/folylpolyglutamate synthase